MYYQPPKVIELSGNESKLYQLISDNSNPNMEWPPIAESMESLFILLNKRKAIPVIRLEIFTNPQYAEFQKKSPKQIFESNGTYGNEIIRHPNFLKYLHYFIKGPDLPAEAIKGFCRILNNDTGTSGEILDQLYCHVRFNIRKYDLDHHSAASNFFRLAVELEIEHDPFAIRAAAMSTR